MLLLMLEAGMPIDCVLTADTGMEFPEMYRHWDKIDQVLYQERGIHLTILRHPKGFEWLMFDQPKEKPKTLENRAKLGVPPYGNGWPGIRVRWCTGQLKTHLIAKEVNRLKKEKNALHYVGIAADEPARIKDVSQRPVDIGTFPKPAGNEPDEIENYDKRVPVEGGAFLAWGHLTYTKPLTEKQAADYELRPAPEVSGLLRDGGRPRPIAEQMKEAARLAGERQVPSAPKRNAPDRGDR